MVTINPHTTRANGTILTATIYNADHNNHVTNAQNLNSAKLEGATPPVVDGDGVVWSGTSGALLRTLGAAPVPVSRSVIAGTGMTGGGNLSADRTLTADFSDQATAEAAASTTKVMSPLRTKNLIDFRLATLAESQAGSDTLKLLTPQRITDRIASQAQAQAGVDTLMLMSPLRVAQAITALVPPSINISADFSITTTTGVDLGVNAQSGAAMFIVRDAGTGAANSLELSFDNGSTWDVYVACGAFPDQVLAFIFYKAGTSIYATISVNASVPSVGAQRLVETNTNNNILARCNSSSGRDFIITRAI